VDEIPLPYSAMTRGAALDVERVEVLKGPQGTLFGQNSTGGAINYIAAKPTDHFSYGTYLDYGRFDATNVEGFVSGALSDTVRARAAVRFENADAWQYSYTRDASIGQRKYGAGRVLLDWDATSSLAFELGVTAWKDESDVQAPQARELAFQTGQPGRRESRGH
jgi:outer membrane receptor protein involved in Fe transport